MSNGIKNCMEEIVFEKIDEVISADEQCVCETCRLDIAAMALNRLTPHYVVSAIGEVYTRTNTLRTQFEVDVIKAVSEAAIIVKQNPRH